MIPNSPAGIHVQTGMAIAGQSQIDWWLADMRARAATARAALPKNSPDQTKVIDDALNKIVTNDPGKYTATIQPYIAQLDSLKTNHQALIAALQTASSDEARARIEALMEANDRDAASVLSAAHAEIEAVATTFPP
jgi:hypothetical protein